MRSSARRRSVMSSWVASHPPSGSGSLTIWIERPSGVDDDHGVALRDVAQHRVDIVIDVADERAGFLAVGDHVAETAARLHDVGRQAVHLEIALVADDQLLRGIEQQAGLASCC